MQGKTRRVVRIDNVCYVTDPANAARWAAREAAPVGKGRGRVRSDGGFGVRGFIPASFSFRFGPEKERGSESGDESPHSKSLCLCGSNPSSASPIRPVEAVVRR